MTGAGRSADQINQEIRALWAGGQLAVEDEVRYQCLVVEWAAAERSERARGEQELAA
ncbi:hypothetical protein V1460_28060 [Streptomyces sp. SCSIO 30461]|uniref:hypothetical protein n=1 Tax=Streptomyces sp. SCSIO 30461 TaxID=3118085 RepID=UPI0030D0A373